MFRFVCAVALLNQGLSFITDQPEILWGLFQNPVIVAVSVISHICVAVWVVLRGTEV